MNLWVDGIRSLNSYWALRAYVFCQYTLAGADYTATSLHGSPVHALRMVEECEICDPFGACVSHGRCWSHSEWE